MKVRFDTNTKSVNAAMTAFSALSVYCPELTVNKSTWQSEVYNLHGEIDSRNVQMLEQATENEFNEDVEKL